MSVKRRRSITKRDRERFIEALAAGWAVRHAAIESGVDFRRWYELRDNDPEFAEEWLQAFELGTQALEDEARRRAVDGYDESTYDGAGTLIRRVRRYDGALLQTMLKGRRPEVYRDNAAQIVAPIAIVLQEVPFAPREQVIEGEARELPEST